MKTKDIEELKNFLKNIADGMDIELVDAVYKVSKNPQLTVYIDTEDGVDLDTCERFHKAIDGPLDEFDFTLGASYTLNVSSPGLDRPLKTARDFEKALGQDVEVKLFAPERGQKFFEGVLTFYDGNSVVINTGGTERKFGLNKIAKINIAVRLD